MDTQLLKDSFKTVAGSVEDPADIARFFYAHLFGLGGTEIIDMFPAPMAPQQDRLLAALIQIVTDVGDAGKLSSYLAQLGKAHRVYRAKPEHFAVVGKSLMATLAHFAGQGWTQEVAETWAAAYSVVAKFMSDALTADDGQPHWWDAVVTDAEQRSYDVTALRIRLSQAMEWAPGQSVLVRFSEEDLRRDSRLPRAWRFYTPAGVPRPARTMDLHVKIVNGGMLSNALARHAKPGARLALGPPVGALRLDESSPRNIVMVAGSTGLAPMMAMLDRLATHPAPPDVALYFGARDADGLYELDRLEKLAHERDWLTLVHAVSDSFTAGGDYHGQVGSIVDVVARDGPWADRDAYICGSHGMVEAAAGRLMAAGVPGGQIHVEDFKWEG